MIRKTGSKLPVTKRISDTDIEACRAAFVFTALHGMQTRSSDENSVRLSVRLSVVRLSNACIVMDCIHCSAVHSYAMMSTSGGYQTTRTS